MQRVKPSNERLVEIDILRIMTTTLVIIGHSAYYQIVTPYGGINYDEIMFANEIGWTQFHKLMLYIVNVIYSFHMPLFFAISGVSFNICNEKGKYKTIQTVILDKCRRLVIPYIVITLFYSCPLKYLGGYWTNSQLSSIDGIWTYIIEGQLLLKGNNYLWFLEALFIITIAIYCLEQTMQNIHSFFKVFILFIISLLRFSCNSPLLFSAMENAIWFYFGYLWYPHRSECKTLFEKQKYLPFVTLIILMLCPKLIIVKNTLKEPLYYISIVSGIAFMYSLALRVVNCLPYRKNKLEQAISYSFGLYLYTDPLNYPILKIVTKLYGIHILRTLVGDMFLFTFRTIGVSMIAIIIVKFLKFLKLKYIY